MANWSFAFCCVLLVALDACAATAPSTPATTSTPTAPPTATGAILANANNPPDTPNYVVSVTQSGPPRWVYMLRYTGNFVLTAPGVLPKTDFSTTVIHAGHDIGKVSVQIVSSTAGRLPSGTPAPAAPAAGITRCPTGDILITSNSAPLGWDALTVAADGAPAVGDIYFGFGKSCGSWSPSESPRTGWAGPLVGP